MILFGHYYEKVEENPIGGILPIIQADPNIESSRFQIKLY